MTDNVHRFVTIEQVVRAKQPETVDLQGLFKVWGLTSSTQEAVWVITYDNMEQVKTIMEVARGGFHAVNVSIPALLAAVLSSHTDRFFIAHNHPSGPVTPTKKDMEMTATVMAAANAAGLFFEDHIITGPGGWFSFHDMGLLQRATESLTAKAATTRGGKKR